MENKEVIRIDFSKITANKHSAQIEGKLFLDDNLEQYDYERVKLDMNHPVQVCMCVILICVGGTAKLLVNLHEKEMKRGTVAVLYPNSFLQVLSVSDDFKFVTMAIAPDFMDYTSDVSMGMKLIRMTMNYPFYNISETELEERYTIYKMLKKKLQDENFMYKEEVALSYINILRCNIYQTMLNEPEEDVVVKIPSRRDEIFNSFIREVEDNYTSHRNVIFYADRLCVTPKYLSWIVHEVSGKYATQWIDEYVILECKTLLKSNRYTIKEICNRLNFSNQSFFAKYFKQHTGVSPKEYKNS